MAFTSMPVALVRLPRVGSFSVGVTALFGLLAIGLASCAGPANAGVITLAAPVGYNNYVAIGISGNTVLAKATDPNSFADAYFTQTGGSYNFLSAPVGYVEPEAIGISGDTVLGSARDPNTDYVTAYFTQTAASYNFLSAPVGYVDYEPIGISGDTVLGSARDPNNDYATVYFTQTGETSAPEIDPATGGSALSLVAGVLAMIEQRRRRATLVA